MTSMADETTGATGQIQLPWRVLGASALVWFGLRRRSLPGLLLAVLGSEVVYRGVTGKSYLWPLLGRILPAEPVEVRHSTTINRSPGELYHYWRRLSNLPRFMRHLESVHETDDTHSRWVARAPAGTTVEWNAEIVEDRPNEVIAWRAVEGSQMRNDGRVRFVDAPGGRGTEVHVELTYAPPAGRVGAAVARLLGEEPRVQIEDDLRRLKDILEAGEIPTTKGQPAGR